MKINKTKASATSWVRRAGAITLASLTAVMTVLSGGVAMAFANNASASEDTKTVSLVDTGSATLAFVDADGRSLSVKSGADVKISISAKDEAGAKSVVVTDVDGETTTEEAVDGVATVKVEKDITVMPASDLAVNAEALKPVEVSSDEVKSLKDYIKENADSKYVGNTSGDMSMADALNVTTTVVDGTKLADATLAKLNEDANGDNIADNDAALANQTLVYTALYDMGDGDYYVGRANTDFDGAKVTDMRAAYNNAEAEMVDDVVYDKSTGLVYVPKSYSENARLALRIQLIVTTDAAVKDAKATTHITANNDGVKGALVDNGSTKGNLQMVQTDIKLSEVDNSEAVISADKIDSVDINGINYTSKTGAWYYNEKTGALTVCVAPYALTDVKLNMSDTFGKSVKKFFDGIVNAVVPGAHADESWISDPIEFPSTPQAGQAFVLDSRNLYKNRGVSGWLNPMISQSKWALGGIEEYIARQTMGWDDADIEDLVTAGSKMSIERSAQIPSQSQNGVNFPAMNVNLMCSHVEVDLPGENGTTDTSAGVWLDNDKVNIRIMAIDGDSMIIGVTVPTVNGQAGAGFFKIKWKLAGGYLSLKKVSADTNITDDNKCYKMTNAQYGVYKNAEATDLAGTLTVNDDGTTGEVFLPEGDYWVKEMAGTAVGYAVNPNVRQVHVAPGEHQSVMLDGDMAERVLHDPVSVLVQKAVEGESDAGYASGDVDNLGGIKFRVDYYDGYYNTADEAQASGAPKASAVFATGDDGRLWFSKVQPVDGTSWNYKIDEYNTAPLGTLVITEVGSHEGLITSGKGSVIQIVERNGVATAVPKQGWSQANARNAVGAFENRIIKGGITVAKADAETHRGEPQGDATLEGVKYQIVNDSKGHVVVNGKLYKKGEVVWTGVTKYDSDSKLYKVSTGKILPYGTYKVIEVEPSTGYLNARWSQSFTIRSDGETHDYISQDTNWNENAPVRGGVAISKVDRETRQYTSLGEAHLDGAIFDIVNKSKRSVVVGGKEYKPGEVVKTIASQFVDGRYIAQTGERDLPYGTYEIYETGAGKGYLFDSVSKKESYTFSIRKDGKIVDMTQSKKATGASEGQAVFDNQVQREDWNFKKKDEDTMERMAGVPFLVTSNTTGESHIIVTDANGTWGSAWNAHTNNTNANDPDSPITNGAVVKDNDGNYVVKDASKLDAEAGTWFTGMSADMTKWAKDGKSYDVNGKSVSVDDALRSFPYDTYTVKELAASTNAGHKLVTFTVTLHKFGKVDDKGVDMDYGTIDNKVIHVKTELHYGKDDKAVPAAKDTKVSDTVSYDNVNDGKYVLKGELHLVNADGKDEGVVAKAEKTFAVKNGNSTGTQTIAFTIDTSDMGGKKLVAFEYLTQNGSEVAKHEDIEDNDQTVMVPKIGTTLTGDVEHEANASSKTITLTDTVDYENLEVGKTYTMSGKLMDKSTGKAITNKDGKELTASTQFVPKDSKGSTTVVFEFTGVDVAGKNVVAFESVKDGDVDFAVHANIEDDGQTVHFPDVKTEATDKVDGDHEAFAGKQQTIVDTVTVNNLTVGKTYKLNGALHVQNVDAEGKISDGGVLKDGDKEVVAEKEFTADKTDMTVTLEFTFNAADLAGKTVTAFETLSRDGKQLGIHADITDVSQSVSFPKVGTNLTDANGSHDVSIAEPVDKAGNKVDADKKSVDSDVKSDESEANDKAHTETDKTADNKVDDKNADKGAKAEDTDKAGHKIVSSVVNGTKVTLTDHVGYENLVPGTEYTVNGKLHLKNVDKDGKVVDGGVFKDASGKEVTGTVTFKPEKASGTVDIKFEFDAANMVGKSVVAFEDLMKGKELVATHSDITDENQTVRIVKIGTTALDAENKTHVLTDSIGETQKISVVDTVAYTNLKVGQPYTVEGKLHMQKVGEDGKIVDGGVVKDKDGKEVTAKALFTPEKSDGTVDVKFEFNVVAGTLDGATLVAFEDVKNGNIIVATHADITDKEQSVHKLKVGTTLTGADKKSKDVQIGDKIDLIDTVSFENLVVGQEYVVKGKLVDASGNALKDKDGKEIVAESKFTPNKATGTAEMKFTVDTSAMKDGDKIVAYEYVYTKDGKLVGHHEDLNDDGQTVVVKQNSKTPKTHVSLKTGIDSFGHIAAIIMGILALTATAVYAYRRRKGQASV